MSRLKALRPYSLALLIPLWMATGIASVTGHRILAILPAAAMLAIVVDTIMEGTGRRWSLRSTLTATTVVLGIGMGGLAAAWFLPA